MFVAQQKLNENVAEYILYMYQVEDVIRGFQFDIERIMNDYVSKQLPDSSFLDQYRSWYEDLIRKMRSQRIEQSGHLFLIQEVLIELSYLHNTLLNMTNDVRYKELYEAAMPHIEAFKDKSNLKDKNHIEILFHALYMKLLLRLQKKEISSETEESFDSMRIMAAYLSRAYHQMKSGELTFN
ncbi:MAG: DUF4924 family protein [Crocinitomicaceae bacterium]|nr:DUF4924 family protein [Crocinitomicaceae bacterium]